MRLTLSVIVCMAFIAFAAAQAPCINPGLCPSDLSNLLQTPCSNATTSCCAKSFLLGLRNNVLVFIDPTNAALGDSFFIVGLVDNDEVIIGMDIRPINGLLYALSNFGRLYTITVDPFSKLATATLVAQTSLVIDPDLTYAFCINPQADRIRVISTDNSNFRINPDNGQVINDTSVTLDSAPGTSLAISACSYTNNVPNATSTLLYGISSSLRRLVTVVPPNSPNAGVFTLVDPNNLVSGVDINESIGFKIFTTPAVEVSYVVLAPEDTTLSPQLSTINLSTGLTTPVGNFPFALDALTVSPVAVCYCPFPSRSLTVIFNPNDGSLICAA